MVGGAVALLDLRGDLEEHKDEDLVTKKGVYERLGGEEYYLFDPLGEYLKPSGRGGPRSPLPLGGGGRWTRRSETEPANARKVIHPRP